MTTLKLSSTERKDLRKSETKKIRRRGDIPATVYGKGPSMSVAVNSKDLHDILKTSGGRLSVIEMTIGGGEKEEYPVMIQAIQRNPISNAILHIDFQRVSLLEPVSASIPLVLAGEAPGTKMGGILEQLLSNLEVKALPNELPNYIEVDVSELNLGDKTFVSDLSVPGNVEVTGPAPETLVATVHMPNIRLEGVTPAEEEAVVEEEEESKV